MFPPSPRIHCRWASDAQGCTVPREPLLVGQRGAEAFRAHEAPPVFPEKGMFWEWRKAFRFACPVPSHLPHAQLVRMRTVLLINNLADPSVNVCPKLLTLFWCFRHARSLSAC